MKKRPIGIFDSGIGGLTVQHEIMRLLPGEDTIYLGDTAHVPYGTKSPATVTRFSLRIAEFLVEHNIKLLVVACNTASAFAIDELKRTLDIPVIGVIEPGVQMATEKTTTGRVGVVGTEGTIRSRAYDTAIEAVRQDIEVFSKACPLFVPLTEEGFVDNSIARLAVEIYLSAFDSKNIDTLVLGCTHYPLLKSLIAELMGSGVTLIDSAVATAVAVKRVLRDEGLAVANDSDDVKHVFYVTDSPERFINVGRKFLGEEFSSVELVNLD